MPACIPGNPVRGRRPARAAHCQIVPTEIDGGTLVASRAPAAHLDDRFFGASLTERDPDVARAIKGELGREQDQIELIASENIVSRAVLEAMGSVLTNKY